ncbi:MAG TPA: hypothetical protein VJR06_01235 [Nitrososphaerales archaeon]|nr:hypothetical protein [Nitrososphaerales archaeon]
MVLKSKIAVARPGANSLRTTIPQGCVEFIHVGNGDGLVWEMKDEVIDGKSRRVLVAWKA